MAYGIASSGYPARILSGFIAGFLATLSFHQLSVWVLWTVGLAPFSMAVTKPFGIPAVISLAAWGGIWGIIFALIDRRFPAGGGYWVAAFLFGAVCPSLVVLFVVLPLKGGPLGGGWHPLFLLRVFLINGAWGVGTGLILRVLSGWFGRRSHIPA